MKRMGYKGVRKRERERDKKWKRERGRRKKRKYKKEKDRQRKETKEVSEKLQTDSNAKNDETKRIMERATNCIVEIQF